MFIGIDIGHTNVKAVAFDADAGWEAVGSSGTEAGMEHPTEDRNEIPIEARWEVVLDCLDGLQDQIHPEGVDGIGLAGGGGGFYPLDADEEPFTNGIPLLDERAKGLIERWKRDGTYREISEILGTPLPPGSALLSLRWLKDNRPDRYETIEHVLSLKDVVRFRLTGERAMEISDATFSFTNHRTQEFDDELLELAGVPEIRDALPELKAASYEVAGHTTPDVEDRTGIAAGTPVVAGAHDACANTLGVGGMEEGVVTTAGGTFSLSTQVVESPMLRLDRWCCENFLETGTWMLEISMPTGTISLDWFVDEFCHAERERAEAEGRVVWDVIEEKIADLETTAMFHPFLTGNTFGYVYPDNATGAFTGLRVQNDRAEMLRAVYEAIAFMHRWQIDLFDDAFEVEEVRFTGGAAKSEFWAGLFADVLGTTVTRTTKEESGCFGAAMLAAIGVGEIDSLESTTRFVEIEDEFHPDGVSYDRKYETFRKMTEGLESVWDEHHALRR
jgi:L-xylulokinase